MATVDEAVKQALEVLSNLMKDSNDGLKLEAAREVLKYSTWVAETGK